MLGLSNVNGYEQWKRMRLTNWIDTETAVVRILYRRWVKIYRVTGKKLLSVFVESATQHYLGYLALNKKLMSRMRNTIVAAGLLAFASTGLAFPFYMAMSSKKQPVIDSTKALPPQATFRGPYVNTGSRDIGPDHQTYPKK